MPGKKNVIALAIAVVTLLVTPVPATAQPEKVLFDFTIDGGVGGDPQQGFIRDAAGNLYGTTGFGGPHNGGAVYEMSPDGSGGWSVKLLHAFVASEYDGDSPESALIFDAAGNLYGTTYFGGRDNAGTVFELMPQANGSWKEKQVYAFGGIPNDGQGPIAGVIFDSKGNLYGTTFVGGSANVGTVFELVPQANGSWKEKILHNFDNNGTDGFTLLAGLVFDRAGNLYGATASGGTADTGTVFELKPTARGIWTETILYNFGLNGDANFPYGTPIFDRAGNLYGTTQQGGAYGWGTVFKLSPSAGGAWSETILHSFQNNGIDGNVIDGGLILDGKGNLYGLATHGGIYGADHDGGIAYELTPAADGGWTEIVLHNFSDREGDGFNPDGNLIFDTDANLYGVTDSGGSTGYGTVFEITK